MKKTINKIGISLLIIAAVTITAFIPQEKNNKKDKQQQQQDRDKKDQKGNQGNQGNQGNNNGKDNKGKNENGNPNDNNDNQGKGNQEKNDAKDKKDKKDQGEKKVHGEDDGYTWDREKFKDRRKYRNKEKVVICHKYNRADGQGVSISVSSNALKAHMNHGDIMGDCPANRDKRYSDDYLRKRNVYYNYLQETEEEVMYSRSILDYARTRLADSRSQLVVYQTNNMPAVEIQRKQAAVTELEQNVGLLEALIGGVAGYLVNKLF